MAEPHAVQRYRRTQRVAHWAVVGLVAIQFLSGGGMAEAYGAATSGEGWPDAASKSLHAASGLAILAVMLWRLSLRRRFGAPPPPAELSPTLRQVSRANHYAFYVLLLAMPLAGAAAAITLNDGLAQLHAASATLLFALIAAHVVGAMWHATRPGSPVLKRMLPIRSLGGE